MNVREWALPLYTILIQLATGALLALWVIRSHVYSRYASDELDRVIRIPVLILFATVCIGIVGAHFHLSKPFLSILAIRNLQHSWLSREIVFTIALFLVMTILTILVWFVDDQQGLKQGVGSLAVLLGLITVYCMSRVYMLPTQIVWNSTMTTLSYFGEIFLLGATSLSAILLMDLNFYHERDPERAKIHDQVFPRMLIGLAVVSLIGLLLTLFFEIEQIMSLCANCEESVEKSVQLLFDLYQPLVVARFSLTGLGITWLLFNISRTLRKRGVIKDLIGPVYVANIMVLVGEILGRFLFYAIHVRIGI